MADNQTLRELLAKTLQREKATSRWKLFAAHLFIAIVLTAISWFNVVTGSEPLGSGVIMITILAFFGCLIHLRSVLYESGMYQPSASEALVNALVQQGVDLESLLTTAQREKPKRSAATISLSEDGELTTDDTADKQPMRSSVR